MIRSSRTRSTPGIAALALAGVLGAGGCDKPPAPGGKCGLAQEQQLVACGGPDTALLCHDLRLGAVPCRGARGCSGSASPSCDETLANEGDACTTPESNESACSLDHTKTLVCRSGHYVASRLCRGPKGCVAGPEPSCDQTIGEAGDVCLRESESAACSVDHKALLDCREDRSVIPAGLRDVWLGPKGKLVVKSDCPTAKGCQIGALEGTEIPHAVCDYRGLAAGDRCGRGDENQTICSPDGAAMLKCDPTSLTFRADFTCPKGQRCMPYDGKTDTVNPVIKCELPAPGK